MCLRPAARSLIGVASKVRFHRHSAGISNLLRSHEPWLDRSGLHENVLIGPGVPVNQDYMNARDGVIRG